MYCDFQKIALEYVMAIQNRDVLLSDDFDRPLAEVITDFKR